MATKTEDLNELSNIIATSVKNYLAHVTAPPTLKPAPLVPVADAAALEAKDQLLIACRRVITLVGGPMDNLMGMVMAFHDTTAMKLAIDMMLPQNVPLDGTSISLGELSKKTGAPEETIVRVMRALTLKDVFVETAPGYFSHTGSSAAMGIPGMDAMLGHCLDESYNSGPYVSAVLRENKFAIPEDSSKSAFSRAYNTNKNFFDYIYSDNKPMGARFGQAMKALSAASGQPSMAKLYPPLLNVPAGTVLVDIGGGMGHMAISAAQAVPGLKCIVQDIGIVIEEGREALPAEYKGRVEFQENNFFMGQPIKGAGVYYLRHILHDHPDPASRKILTNIARAMDKDSRLLIDESIMDERMGPDTNWTSVVKDLQMLMMCNSKERTEAQWTALLKSADERLVIEKVRHNGKVFMGIIEARLA